MQLLRQRTEIRRKLSMNAAAAELPSFFVFFPNFISENYCLKLAGRANI